MEHTADWENLKKAMTKAPVLAQPNSSKHFVVETDASAIGLGAVLSQPDDEGNLRPCAFASRKLNPQETRYSTREQEALAIIWAIGKFSDYLRTRKFTVLTDHSSLQWLLKQDVPKGRLLNWAYHLRQYDFEIIYRKGVNNPCADALSRLVDVSIISSSYSSDIESKTLTQIAPSHPSHKKYESTPTNILTLQPYSISTRGEQARTPNFKRKSLLRA